MAMTSTIKKNRFLMIVTVILLCWTYALPQDTDLEKFTRFIKKKRINAAYGLFGGHQLNFNTFNEQITPWGYPALTESHFTYGLGGHVVLNKLVLCLEIQHFFKKAHLTALDFNTSAEANSLTVNFGYLAYSQKGLMIYPLTGIGVGKLNVNVTENNIHSFQDINALQRSTISARKSLVLNLGIGCDYFLNYNKKKKGKNCLMIGFRTGYKLPVVNDDWTVNGMTVTNGPDSAFSGPYFHVVVGIGGWMEKLIKIAMR